jgi:beta-phosphoglucomutase-like phosphatase (HAD superfamily)
VKPAASMLDSSAPGELPGGQLTVGPAFVESADLAGLVFDVDGTLLDTMPAFYPSWNIAGEKYGVFLSEEDFYKSAGLPLDVIVRRLFLRCLGHEPDDATVDAFLKLKKETHLELEKAAGAPPAIACVVEIAREAEARGIPVAIATSGSKDDVERHLASNDLTDIFPVGSNRLVFGADVPGRGKPAPDIYLEAARRLGVDPARCRAFEDGESGLRAAHAAGMHVVDVTAMDRYPAPEGLRRAKADAQAARDWL